QFAGGAMALGFLGGAGAVQILGDGIKFLIEHTTGLSRVTQNALAISNDDIRLRQDAVAAIEAQVSAFETAGNAIGSNTDKLRVNLAAQKEILAFDLGTREQGIGQAFTRQNENLQRFRAVNEPARLLQALGPALTPIIGQGGFTEIDFILSKTREFFGGKADDASQAMRKLALETIPLFVSQGQTMEQGLERIRQQFGLAPGEVNAFRQALEQLGGVSQLSLPTRIADLQQAQKFAALQKRAPKFANQFGHLFQPEFLARQSLEESLVDAAKHPAGEAGRASILAALAALVGKENEHAQRAEQILRERKAIDDRISALTRKGLSGLTGQFAGIDHELADILGRQHLTSGQGGRARLAAGSAKNTALREFLDRHTKEVQGGLSQKDIDTGLADLSKRMLEDVSTQQRALNEISKLNGEIRVANATSEVDRIIAQHKLEAEAFERSELFKTASHDQQIQLRGKFEELFHAQQEQRRRDRLRGLDDEIAMLQAEVSGRNKNESELLQLFAKQQKEKERALGRGPDEIQRIETRQGLELIQLQQRQYDNLFSTVKNQAEGVFDAIFTRGRKGFAGLLDYVKGVFATRLKDIFGDIVATLFVGRRPGLGGASGPAAGFGGLFNLGGLFGGGGGGFVARLRAGFGFGGNLAATGVGAGTAATGTAAAASGLLTASSFAPALGGSVASLGSAGLGGALPASILAGSTVPGLATGGTAAAGGAAGGGFSLFGLSGAQLGAFFTNPFTIAAGIGIGATILALKLRKSREDKFREEILRDFAINVQEKRVLQDIKRIGESAFGREADRKRFETLRLDPVQSLLLNYAQATGQSPGMLPLYQRFFGRGLAPQSLSFDHSRGIPAFANGGIVPGVDTGRDSVLSFLRPGERVVPKSEFNSVQSAPVLNFNVSVDARGATDPAATADKVQKAVEAGIKKVMESGSIGAWSIERSLVRHVTKGLKSDFGRAGLRDSLF
ncbi:MAG: hypothetical protein L0312_03005, partial [Acidobacteria bacterium]|nr:hypothetical protein [Acidobacteriota bacterium]